MKVSLHSTIKHLTVKYTFSGLRKQNYEYNVLNVKIYTGKNFVDYNIVKIV